MSCAYCDNTGWVCENHPEFPWRGVSERFDVCQCGGAGAPCERCNTEGETERAIKHVIRDKNGDYRQ